MKAYSQDLRHRVLATIDAGFSQAEVAETFAISVATIKRYLKARRESGHVLPKAIPGRPALKGAALQQGLLLAPSLRPGQIVVLDNLSIHQGARVRQAIEARGCRLLFLPAYSPDFSPIEEAFSKLKAYLRRVGARTHEALQDAIAQALTLITAQDALGWFLHCGYPPLVLDEKAQHLCTPL